MLWIGGSNPGAAVAAARTQMKVRRIPHNNPIFLNDPLFRFWFYLPLFNSKRSSRNCAIPLFCTPFREFHLTCFVLSRRLPCDPIAVTRAATVNFGHEIVSRVLMKKKD
jgi:hypothetical protein